MTVVNEVGARAEETSATGRGLSPYLASVRDGQDEDYRTPLWDSRPRGEILAEWDSIFETMSMPGRLGEIELDQRAKVGPLSIRLPLSERLPNIKAYFTGFLEEVPELQDFTRSGEGRLRPLDLSAASQELAGNTNSGFPRFTRRNRVRESELSDAKSGKFVSYPAILGWRGQSSGLVEDPKQRTVWMYPMSTNVVEMSYFRPVQQLMLAKYPVLLSAWRSPDDVDANVQKLLQFGAERGVPVVSIDFTSYDQSVGPNLSKYAFDTIRAEFQSGTYDTLEIIESVFNTIELIIQPSERLSGRHGVPSGSVFTNIIDTIVQDIAHRYVANECNADLSGLELVQGDDGLLAFTKSQSLDQCFTHFLDLGLDANPDKQFIGDGDCLYLQRYHMLDWHGGIYPSYRALNSLMGQERFYDSDEWGPEMVVLRSIMILENTKYHPLFEHLVRFVQSGDRYRLGADWPGGIDSLLFGSDVIARAEKLAGFVPSYNQEDRLSGIREFSTYKLIKETT